MQKETKHGRGRPQLEPSQQMQRRNLHTIAPR
jgi:hypothetical protein